jgi:lantibiotic modifying enzyme
MDRRTALAHTAALAAASWVAPPRVLRALASSPDSVRHRGAPADYRAAALSAERWIAASAVRDRDGVRWPADPAMPSAITPDLYSGSAGVVLFYLELHHATGNERYLKEAVAGTRALIAAAPSSAGGISGDGAGLYTGVAGLAYVAALVQRIANAPELDRGVAHLVALLKQSARPSDAGIAWNDSTDIISGTAGIALTLAWLGAQTPHGANTDALLRGASQSLLAAGRPAADGLTWAITPLMPRRYPNFSHGAAGVGYTLATLAQHEALRGTQGGAPAAAAQEGALAAARYLERITTRTSNGGRRIFHSEPGGEQLFYLSWCHGPAGTARLYRQLTRLTGNPAWSARLPELSRGIIDSGVPEQHPDRSGFWNNISQCCGNCGVAEYFTARFRVTRDPADLAFAQRVMDNTVARATTEGDTLRWVQAENRATPEDLKAQTGYMQGSAGVGVALLHLEGAQQGRAPLVVLPDTPVW